jgi:hypothetical protein
MANILLMGQDLLHGNVLPRGWHMSDVSFYPTELVQYALLESVLGLHMTTAHVAAAMTYTMVVLLVVLLASLAELPAAPGLWRVLVLNLALYLGTMASTEGAHEIAIVLPYAAALAARTLAPSLPGGEAIRGKAGGRTRVSARAVAGALVLCGYLAGYTVLTWHRNLLRLRDHDDGAAGVARQPAWHGADQVVPEVPRRTDHERVGTELGRDRGEFPRRAAAPGAHVDLEPARVRGLVKLGQQPPLKRVRVPQQPDHLAGQRLAVNAWRRHVDHEQRPAEPAGHAGGVGKGVARGSRPVVPDHDGVRQRDAAWLRFMLDRFRAQGILLATALGPPLVWRALFRGRLVHLRVLAATGGR